MQTVTLNDMMRNIGKMDAARNIYLSKNQLWITHIDGECVIYRFTGWRTMRRLFRRLLAQSIIMDMGAAFIFCHCGRCYNWHDYALAMLATSTYDQFVDNLLIISKKHEHETKEEF